MTVEEALEIAEQALDHGYFSKIQEIVFRQAWQGQSYGEIAKASGYDLGYIRDTGSKLWQQLSAGLGKKVTKHNFQAVLKQVALRKDEFICAPDTPHSPLFPKGKSEVPIPAPHKTNWGGAIDVSIFYGRTNELITLKQWLLHDRCRLVTLLGMGGMGKTALSVKLVEVVQVEFEYLLWHSLRDATPVEELLKTLIQFLSNQQDTQLPESISGRLNRLIDLLRRSRCLIVLDNFDTVFQSGQRASTYRSGYENYGELLKCIGEVQHSSCVVLTTREKPQEIAALEGERLPVRTLPLAGLDAAAGEEILQIKGLTGTTTDTTDLIAHYRGNPLALKIAATSIQDIFAGDIAQFLVQRTTAFNSISTLLAQQCDRLSPLEQQVMYWLAINREPTTLCELQADLTTAPLRKLMTALESLCWRSLIESSVAGFTQQPVIMEFITERLIEQVSDEIVAETPQLFCTHALMKAQVKDYIRESQIRAIIKPIIARLLVQLSPKQLEHKLSRLLTKLRQPSSKLNYGVGNLLNLFCQLETDLTGYDFSGLSIRQAYLQDHYLHCVNFTEAKFVDCAFAATFGGITCVAFSPDGQIMATSDTNGGIQIWNIVDGKQLACCKGHNSWVWSVAFNPTQPTLASCGQDHTVRLWDVNSGECLKLLEGHTGIVTAIAFSPDGCWLASCSGDQTIRLWNVATGQCFLILQGHHACVWSVVFHPNGKTLFSAGEDKAIRTWDLKTGSCLHTFSGHHHWVKAISLSPNGELLASGSFDQTLKLWNSLSGECLATLSGHHKPVTSVAFSPADGQMLSSSSYDQTVRLWSVASQQCINVLQKHTNSIWSVAFHPQGFLLASGGEDYTARLWNIHTGQCTKTLQGHSNSIYSIALNSSQQLLASGHEDQTIKLWDFDCKTSAASKAQPFRVLRGHRGRVFSVIFSPDGKILASGSFDHTIKLWNPYTGQCLHTLQGHNSWVWGIAFCPNGQSLASASYDHTIRLWEVKTGKCLHLQEHTSSVLAIAFSPDGQFLASGGYEQTIKLWNAKTGQCIDTWQAHLNRVWAVDFSPNGQWLATGGDDCAIKLWEISTKQCIYTLQGHTSQILAILFSPDGNLLFSSSADRTIKIWNINTAECLATLAGHMNWVWSLVLSPSNQTLLSGSQDETIKSWDISTHKCLQTLQVPRPYEGMDISRVTGLTEAEVATLKALGAIEVG